MTPHVTQSTGRNGGSAIDRRTTRHNGYAKSQHARPRIEPAFGWLKTIAWLRKVKLRGLSNVQFQGASAVRRLGTVSAERGTAGGDIRPRSRLNCVGCFSSMIPSSS